MGKVSMGRAGPARGRTYIEGYVVVAVGLFVGLLIAPMLSFVTDSTCAGFVHWMLLYSLEG